MKYLLGVLAAIALLTFAGISTVAANHRGPDNCGTVAEAEAYVASRQLKLVKEKGTYRLYVGEKGWTVLNWSDKPDTVCQEKYGEGEAPADAL